MNKDFQPTRPPQKHMKNLLDQGLIPMFYKSVNKQTKFTYLAVFNININNRFMCGIRRGDGAMVGFQITNSNSRTMLKSQYKLIDKDEMELLSIYEEGF